MGLLLKSFTKQQEDIESSVIMDEGILNAFKLYVSSSGEYVSEQSAMQLAAVYSCVQLISKTIAMTPLILYKRTNVGKERAYEHPLYDVLKNSANRYMPAFQIKESMMLGNLLDGNSYAMIMKNRRGQTRELAYIPHKLCYPKVEDGKKVYKVTKDGEQKTYSDGEILHIPGLSYDGIKGLSPIQTAKETIGKGIATQKYGNSFFKNGAKLSGVFEHPAVLGEDAFNRLKESIDAQYSGAENANKTILLEEGTSYKQISVPPEQAQFLETMKFNVNDIARIFGVPPHMIGDLERSTFSNIEHQSIEFVMYTMLPWFSRWEQFINFKCLSQEERQKGYFVEFLIEYLLRGDTEARTKMYQTMRQNGVLNGDEWRAKENMNEMPNGQGKHYFVNGSMISIETALESKRKK